MMWYSIEPRTRKYIKRHGFLSFARKYKKQLLNTWLGASKKVVHEAGEFIGNKIGGAVNDGNVEKQEPVEQIIIPPEKRDEILNKLRKVLWKWNTLEYLNLWEIQLYPDLWRKMCWSKWFIK